MEFMCWKKGILAALAILLLIGPTLGDDRVNEIQDLLIKVSTELAMRLDVLSHQKEEGLDEASAETRLRILKLIEDQRALLSHLKTALKGGARETPVAAPPTDELQAAIHAGLFWLAAHQNSVGYWHPLRYWEESGHETIDGIGNPDYAVGVTALVLMAFLEDGHTYRKGEFKKTVQGGFKYLKEVQDPQGCFGPRESRHFVYNHAIATLAMVRHYEATKVVAYKRSAAAGVDFILKARNPGAAWRYGIRPKDNDTSVTGWMIAALAAARDVGIKVEQEAFQEPREWIDRVTNPKTGHVGYEKRDSGPARAGDMVKRFPPRLSAAMTAAGNAIRLDSGVNPKESTLFQKSLEHMMSLPPSPAPNAADHYYWYWGSRVAAAVGGQTWRAWSKPMREILLARQQAKGRTRGSFDPDGPWSLEVGRVYQTAIMILIAETLATH